MQKILPGKYSNLGFRRNLVLSDNSKSSALYQIKPKGLFSYSLKDGFVGEEEELLFKTQEVSGRSMGAGELITATNTLTDLVKNESVEKNRSRQVERSGVNSIWIFLLLILLILFFYLAKSFEFFKSKAIKKVKFRPYLESVNLDKRELSFGQFSFLFVKIEMNKR